jgi:proteic killer suppression protein
MWGFFPLPPGYGPGLGHFLQTPCIGHDPGSNGQPADCNRMGYTIAVAITGFRHKGLERFFTTGAKSGIQARHADRLRLILGRLNVATSAQDMNLPGLDLHDLRGPRKGTWAVKVSGNWRLTFASAGRDVERVDYEDYH